MNVTEHQRPGVYSVYNTSSVTSGRSGSGSVGLAAVCAAGEAGKVYTLNSYEQAVSVFTENEAITGLIRLIFRNGAAKVYAVDVGYGQLAWKLRQDERVVVLEETNARYLTAEQIPEPLDAATIDAAFISLGKLLPALYPLLKPEGFVMALIKPQFEAGREKVGKNGVVREPAVHLEVIRQVLATAEELGFCPWGLDFSPIKGPKGNIEYLLWLGKQAAPERKLPEPEAVVQQAAAALHTKNE